ncbi:substrate-binding periplasmic protein [Colwellia hornerae]|uniref:Amino acid ABC transporter substrate-binding protein n=1 Tax=Colwellia hornerae TaxID=89402 RepID=A0A5C6QCT5_9GAMM|nr:transporter substrate-binding domain-containing protein [Colwellia hornerae]TWX55193.1 amino acid ABC transporter substrate-binding protein [Colwellia hornerae]TWX61193.1 amino acid ABC transporter substrate-binding protein [Colwellia hornerae]TWX66457.1 amino acid ABC transporter substrate-binding protein [Colwellia hornerae]
MLNNSWCQLLILALLLLLTTRAAGQPVDNNHYLPIVTLKFDPSGSSAWYPYYINSGEKRGIVVDAVAIILATANISGKEIVLPPKRTNLSLKNGLVDFDLINPDWLSKVQQSNDYVFSDPVIPIKEHIIYLAGTALPKNLGEDQQLTDQHIGTVRGYYYHNDNLFNRLDYPSEKELVKALFRKRISFAISGDKPAQYWAKTLSVPIILGPVHSDGYLRIRLRKELKYLLPQINDAIELLKVNGSIESIMNAYI